MTAQMNPPDTPGPQRSPLSTRTRVILLLTVLAGAIVAPILLIPLHAERAARFLSSGSYANAQRRLRAEALTLTYAPPVDSGISPLEAGEAHNRIAAMLRAARWSPESFERVGGPRIPLPSLDAEDAPFRDSRSGAGYPATDSLFARALRGFTPAEAAWLREVADHPVWAEQAVLARAPALDLWGARFELPLPDSVTPYEMPIVPLGALRDLHSANVARAALALGQNDSRRAEDMLRESVGVARVLATGSSGLDLVMAGVMAGRARDDLVRFYERARPSAAQALRVIRDSVTEETAAARRARPDAQRRQPELAERRRQLLAGIRDDDRPVGVRIEEVLLLGGLQCSSLREALFGPSAELRAAVAYAQDSVARYPSERSVIAMALDTPERLAHWGWSRGRFSTQWSARWLNVTGKLLGNARLRGCARWLSEVNSR